MLNNQAIINKCAPIEIIYRGAAKSVYETGFSAVRVFYPNITQNQPRLLKLARKGHNHALKWGNRTSNGIQIAGLTGIASLCDTAYREVCRGRGRLSTKAGARGRHLRYPPDRTQHRITAFVFLLINSLKAWFGTRYVYGM